MQYRFPHQKDASWNSYNRQKERYEVIKNLLGEGSVGAEIGVYKGGFGEFLLPHCKKLYLVDPWYRLKPYWGKISAENSAARALFKILEVYLDEVDKGQVEIIPDFSISFLRSVNPQSLDWVYLDASHRYSETIEEIRAALVSVKNGGFIIGDDYDPDPESNQHGVYLAVNDIVESYGAKLIINESRQWAFQV